VADGTHPLPEPLHRDHELHELIDGDLGGLAKARRLVRLEVRFLPAQRPGMPLGEGWRGECTAAIPGTGFVGQVGATH